MASKWYGSVNNRIEENRMFCDEIKVGTGMTEYLWSDRHAYEVVEVTDQKHIKVREYDHRYAGDGSMDNVWELISNPENPIREMVKWGKYWYFRSGYVDENGRKSTCRVRANVSFGKASYYYDYSF